MFAQFLFIFYLQDGVITYLCHLSKHPCLFYNASGSPMHSATLGLTACTVLVVTGFPYIEDVLISKTEL